MCPAASSRDRHGSPPAEANPDIRASTLRTSPHRIDPAEVIDRTKRAAQAARLEVNGEMGAIMLAIFADLANVYITGGAGTGKTTFLKHVLIPELERRGLNYAITASTGIAGSHVDGKTLHSFLGIGLGPEWPPGVPILQMDLDEIEEIYEATYQRWQNNGRIPAAMRDGLTRKLVGTEVILLEEVSMISGWGLLGYVDYFLKKVRQKPDKPFGGIQMIFVGDMGQLPPVEKYPSWRPDWAFESKAWQDASVRPMKFTKIHRQKAGWFTDFLNETRDGIPVSPTNIEHLRNHLIPGATPKTHSNFTFLCATNKEADHDNHLALDQYPGPVVEAKAFFDVREEQLKFRETIDEVQRRLIDGKAAIRPTLQLKVGLPVLITVNNHEAGYVNGTKGFVHGFTFDKADPTKPLIVEVRVPHPDWPQRFYLDYAPPLGALNPDRHKLPGVSVTLGGEEFPFRLGSWGEIRPNRELEEFILNPAYREAGWVVTWGPEFHSERDGLVRTFRLSPALREG